MNALVLLILCEYMRVHVFILCEYGRVRGRPVMDFLTKSTVGKGARSCRVASRGFRTLQRYPSLLIEERPAARKEMGGRVRKSG